MTQQGRTIKNVTHSTIECCSVASSGQIGQGHASSMTVDSDLNHMPTGSEIKFVLILLFGKQTGSAVKTAHNSDSGKLRCVRH